MTDKHKKERWLGLTGNPIVRGQDENNETFVGMFHLGNSPEGRYIIASHNACLNIPVEALEAGVVDEMIEVLKDSIHFKNTIWYRVNAVLAKLEGE